MDNARFILHPKRIMAEEIELKLALAEKDQSRFLRHPLLRRAAQQPTETLDNIYYDTPDLALQRRGIALRLRRQGGRWLQTVKLAGTSAAGLASRPEWETPYTGHFDFSTIDAEDTRAWLQRPRLLAQLVPIFETRFRRRTWRFAASPGAVLLTLDRGWIIAGEKRAALSELELELAGAPLDALFALALPLAERMALTPAVSSKAERGYRLYTAAATQPVKAADIALSGDMPPLDAFRRIALACLDQMQQNHAGAVATQDPEFIHQMRVATRRLSAALRLFAPILPADFAQPLKAAFRPLMKQLGHVRDLDVLHTEIVALVLAALPDEPRLAALSNQITLRRHHARKAAYALLRTPGYGHMLLTALQILHGLNLTTGNAAPFPGDVPAAQPGAQPSPSLATFAAQRLRRLNKQVMRKARAARIDNPESLHALRIAGKRLRYALEFFSPLASPREQRDTLRQLTRLQNTLGQLNDLAQAGDLLMDCANDDSLLREAVTLIGGWHGPRYAALLATVPNALKSLERLHLPALSR
nr:J93 [uncultured bacterium]